MMKFLLFGALFCSPAAGLKMGRVYKDPKNSSTVYRDPKNSSTQLNLAHTTESAQWHTCFGDGNGCKSLLGPLGVVCCKWCPYSVSCDTFWTKKQRMGTITWYGGDNTCDRPLQTMEITGFPQNPGLSTPKEGFKLWNYISGSDGNDKGACMTVKFTRETNYAHPDDTRYDTKSISCRCIKGLVNHFQENRYGDNQSPWIHCTPYAKTDCTYPTKGANAPIIDFYNLDEWYVPKKGRCWANKWDNTKWFGAMDASSLLGGSVAMGLDQLTGAPMEDATGQMWVDSTLQLYDQNGGVLKCDAAYNPNYAGTY